MKITKNILEYSVFIGLFAIIFIPFIVPSAFFFPFITGKGFTFRILVEILFGLFTILAFIDKEYRPKLSWITKSVIFFTVVTLIADLLGVNPYKSIWSNYERMEGFVLIAHLALYYIVASSFLKTLSRWTQYIHVTIGASVLMCFYSLLQLAGKININQGSERVDATFGNATYFAIYLVFHIFLSVYMLVDSNRAKWQRWTYGLVALLEIVMLYFTATRGAILGLIGGFVLTGLIIIFKEKENIFLRKVSYGILGAVAIVVLVFFSVRNTDYVKQNRVLSRFSTLSFSEIKTQGRYFVWPMAFKGVIERPIFGWGQENFNFVFNKNYDPRMYAQEQWFDRTHNVFLDWLIAGGIVGFLAYASMYIALFYYIWRKDSPLKLSEKSVFTGMISAYIFHNIFVFDNLISYILFFSVLAYIHSISPHREDGSKGFYTKVFSNDTVAYIVIPTVSVITLGMVYFINVPAISANKTLIEALTFQGRQEYEKSLDSFNKAYSYNSFGDSEITEQAVQTAVQVYNSQNLPASIRQDFYSLAKTKIEEKVKEVPNDARYLMFAGSLFNRTGNYVDAIKYLNRALEESPKKPTILFELGTSYIGNGDLNKMFEIFKKAYELEPNSNEAKIIYAVGAIYTRNSSVLSELNKKIDRSVVISDDRILRAYLDIGDYTAVIAILNARVESDPNNVQHKLSLASVYASIGQKQQAINIIRAMIDKDPSFKEQGEVYIKEIQSR